MATFLVLPAALAALEARGWRGGARRRGSAAVWRGWRPAGGRRSSLTVLVAVVGAGVGACQYMASGPFETDFKNLRSTGPEMKETRRWNESIDRAFGRGISGGTVIALPTRERAREVAERMRAADRAKPAATACSRASRRWTIWCRADQDDKRVLLADIRRLLTKQTLASMTTPSVTAARDLMPPATVARSPTRTCPSRSPGRSRSATARAGAW